MSPVGQGTEADSGSVSRRDFLRVGGLSVVGLSVGEQAAQLAERQSSLAVQAAVSL